MRKFPAGAVPMKVRAKSPMTRPRISSEESVWSMVLHVAKAVIMLQPVMAMTAIPASSLRHQAKRTRLRLKSTAAVPARRGNPRRPSRRASMSEPATAPRPMAPMRSPTPWGPASNMRSAKTGMMVRKGTPARLNSASSVSMAPMSGRPKA